MKTAQVVVLAVAVAAGGAALYLASGPAPKPAQVTIAAPPQIKTTDVLVENSDIGLGQSIKQEDFEWQSWPAATASASFIRRENRADAVTQLTGSIARSPMLAGEPVRDTKLVKGDG